MRSLNVLENLKLAEIYLLQYKKIEHFPYIDPKIIEEYQLSKIKKLVRLAYNYTLFYRKKYDALGIHPEDIKTLNDFRKLPTVTKDEIIEFHDQCVVENKKNDPNLILTRSSGSSGKILNIMAEGQFFIDKALMAHRTYKDASQYRADQTQLLIYTSQYPYRSIMGAYKAHYINNLASSKEILDAILDIKPVIISGYPSVLLEVIHSYREELKKTTWPKAIITHSEQSTQAQRDFIGDVFKCRVYDEYSTEELSKCAYQCIEKKYHIQEDSAYLEILNPNSNELCREGVIGEIIGTGLHNNVMPFIRYRQGDLGSIETSHCKCKRTTRILANISGRKNHSFKLADGRIIPSGKLLDWTYLLFLNLHLPILQFQIVQKELNYTEIIIVPGKNYKSSIHDQAIIKSFKEEFGEFLVVKVIKTRAIEKTPAGKHIPIKSYL